MGGIFVSYRRKDSAGHAGRLFDRLRDYFGKERVFRDVDEIRAGDDFVETLARAVGSCDAFVLVIGRDWLDARDDRGARRLDDPEDFIRIELETALRRKILVLPVLVEGAKMVEAAELPEPLRPLARRQAIELSEHRWDFDVQELLKRIEDVVRRDKPIWKSAVFRASAAVVLLSSFALGALWIWSPWKTPATDGSNAATPASPLKEPENRSVAKSDSPKANPTRPAEATPAVVESQPEKKSPPPPAVTADGDRPARLPSFIGQPFREAADSLRRLGMQQKVEFNSTGRNTPGTVFGQDPRAGSAVNANGTVRLFVETTLRPEEHAAGVIYLTPSEVLMLDGDEDDARGAWDVSFQRPTGASANLSLQFGAGVTGVRMSPAAANASRFDAVRCRNTTTSFTNRSILIPPRLDSNLDVCVRTTKGRLALLRLEELTAAPELRLRYSTLR